MDENESYPEKKENLCQLLFPPSQTGAHAGLHIIPAPHVVLGGMENPHQGKRKTVYR